MYQKTLFFAIFLLCIILYHGNSQSWIRNCNGSANSTDISRKICIDASGNSYITGFTTNLISNRDLTTIKYNSAGVQQWVASYNNSSSGNDEAYAITIDIAGNVYVAGTCYNNNTDKDIVLIKYNSSGIQQWVSIFTSSGSYSDEAYAITLDNAGNPIIAGYSSGDNMGYSGGSLITSILSNSNYIPSSFGLHQNYPNPFNPVSIFKFDIPENSFVKISVFDAMGRELFSPVNDYLNAGTHAVSLTMNKYSSGVYFYKMTAGNFMDIKKMILIK
jgi:hypothetical protein